MIWYKICTKFVSPNVFMTEFTKETESYLILKNGGRVAKHTQYEQWFRTWEEARTKLMEVYVMKIKVNCENLDKMTRALADIEELEEEVYP